MTKQQELSGELVRVAEKSVTHGMSIFEVVGTMFMVANEFMQVWRERENNKEDEGWL